MDARDMNDTKLAWKRRALKAEAELEAVRKINDFHASNQLSDFRDNVRMKIVLDEIEDSLNFARAKND